MEKIMKKWKVTAEINMDASKYVSVIIEANTENKARIKGINKIKEDGAFHVSNISIIELKEK
jgi:hypothetical protein